MTEREDFNTEEFVKQCEKAQEENLHKPAPQEIYEDVPWYRRIFRAKRSETKRTSGS